MEIPNMKTVVIIPTYNERGNIDRLIEALQRQFQSMPHEMHILVVDDNSPDATAEVVRALQQRHSNLHLIQGEKVGLGAAYIRGMRHALDQLGAETVFEMDADFSHKPQDVPRLMQAIVEGSDFVIGSRYVKGSSISADWGPIRKFNSMFGNIVARYVAGIYRVHDCTAGFRAIRSSVLRRVNFSALRVKGYAFQVALLHAAVAQRAQIREIPVDFPDRTHGESKLGFSDIIEFIVNAWWIRFQSSKTFIKFCIVGASGVVVNLAVFTALLVAGMNRYIASPIAIEVSILSNFLFNNIWTFRWRTARDSSAVKGLKFNAVSILSLVISYGTFVALSMAFPDVRPQIHQLIGIVPATLVNYFMNSYWTFRNAGEKA